MPTETRVKITISGKARVGARLNGDVVDTKTWLSPPLRVCDHPAGEVRAQHPECSQLLGWGAVGNPNDDYKIEVEAVEDGVELRARFGSFPIIEKLEGNAEDGVSPFLIVPKSQEEGN